MNSVHFNTDSEQSYRSCASEASISHILILLTFLVQDDMNPKQQSKDPRTIKIDWMYQCDITHFSTQFQLEFLKNSVQSIGHVTLYDPGVD